jgi:predicted nucleic acid-binding protein
LEEPRQARHQTAYHNRSSSRDQGKPLNGIPWYLVDSSVISKVFLLDEDLVDETRALFEAFYAGRLVLLTPELAYLEVANSIVKAVRQNRLSREAAGFAIDALFDLALEKAGDSDQLELAIREAHPIAEELQTPSSWLRHAL